MKKRIITFIIVTSVVVILSMLYYIDPIHDAIIANLETKKFFINNTKEFYAHFKAWEHNQVVVAILEVIVLSIIAFVLARFEPVNDKTMDTLDVIQQSTIIKEDNSTNIVIVEEKEGK